MADAFEVRGPEGERRVLRLLHPVHVVDARAIARCLDEARALLYPPHASIVPVEDSGQLPDGRVYLVGEDAELRPAMLGNDQTRSSREQILRLVQAHEGDPAARVEHEAA